MMALQKLRAVLALVALTSVVAGPAAVYGQTTGASLDGHVADESGAPTPGATVTVLMPETGFTRTLTTQSDGSYRFASLPVGTYDVSVTLTGFKTTKRSNVVLNVSTGRTIDFSLAVASVEEAVTVTAGEAVVASEVAIGTVVNQKELENLPLNGRQFANLGVLAPGTSLSYNSDPTKPGQLVVALNGGSGRNVNYVIDGGDNTDDTIGGQLQNFSIEGVQEFKIQTQEYKAEYGRSTGGVMTVVGKSGTNALHGSGFGFLRNDSLNSITKSEELAGGTKSDYSRKQFGGSLGGPIVKDKVFFFGTYEGTRRDTNYTQNTGGLIAGDGTTVPLRFSDDLASGKVTANLTPTQLLQVRFGYQKNADKYGASPLASPDSLGTVTNKYHSILVGHSSQFGSSMANELVLQYTKFDNLITPDSTLPALAYPNGAHSGENLNTPQSTQQEKYQFKDDFAFTKTLGGHVHDFKVGVNLIHEPTLSGNAATGVDAPLYTLLESVVGSPVKEINQNGGNGDFSTPTNQYSVYVQDDWHASRRLTLNIGVRYDLFTGFDLNQTTNPIWQTLSTQTTHTDPIYQPFLGGKGGVLETDHNNIAPRIGFAYDLTGEEKKFLRGGYGIYYDFPYTNATILFPALAVQTNYGQAYDVIDPTGIRNADGSFYQIGQPLPPNQLPGLASNPPNDVASPDQATPFSRQGSIGFSAELTRGLAIAVDGVNIQYRDLPYRSRGNPLGPDGARIFPAFGNFRIWSGNGKADYWGGNLSVRARISDRFTLQGFYTLSKITGNTLAGADEFRITNVNYQPDLGVARDNSVDPYNPLCDACIGPLNTDARHRVTLAGTYEFPYHILFSGMFRYRSATPYTVYAGVDLNGDGFVMDLPPGVIQVNSARGSSFSQLDLRLSKNFKFGKSAGLEILGEVFNLFNAENPAGYVGNQAASNFGQPTTYSGDPLQGEQRLAQFGVRLRF